MTATSNAKIAMQTLRNVRNQGNMTLPKEQNNFLVTDHKDREICDLTNKKFKIIVLKKLGELQENTERQRKSGK